jgi:hypothetical protein
MAFFVGQKVACVNGDGWFRVDGDRHGPDKNEICTVTKVVIAAGNEGLRLAEYPHSFGYLAECFRSVVEKKTDISIFTKMLNKAPARQHEVV